MTSDWGLAHNFFGLGPATGSNHIYPSYLTAGITKMKNVGDKNNDKNKTKTKEKDKIMSSLESNIDSKLEKVKRFILMLIRKKT